MTKENTAALVVEDDIITSAPEPIEVTKSELDTLKEQIEEKNKEIERERQRAEAAERQREEYSQKLTIESNNRVKAEGSSIENLIAAKQIEAAEIERQIEDAVEKGDFKEQAKLVSKYALINNKLEQYEEQKGQLAARSTQPVYNDPLSNYSERTKQWIKRNPEFLSDSKFQAKALAAHQMAISEDYTPDSDAYFEYIEDFIKPKLNTEEISPKKVSTALPPSRTGSSGSTAGNTRTVRLTPEEVESAMICYRDMSPADAQNAYYQEKQRLIKLGKIGSN